MKLIDRDSKDLVCVLCVLGISQFQILKVVTRVSRSYSLKAKISENVGIFVLALKRKKVVNFALFA